MQAWQFVSECGPKISKDHPCVKSTYESSLGWGPLFHWYLSDHKHLEILAFPGEVFSFFSFVGAVLNGFLNSQNQRRKVSPKTSVPHSSKSWILPLIPSDTGVGVGSISGLDYPVWRGRSCKTIGLGRLSFLLCCRESAKRSQPGSRRPTLSRRSAAQRCTTAGYIGP